MAASEGQRWPRSHTSGAICTSSEGRPAASSRLANDLWRFDPKTAEWLEIAPKGDQPLPRTACAYDGTLVVFGGGTAAVQDGEL
jgi:hypothetical protein